MSVDVGRSVQSILEELALQGGEEFGARIFDAREGLRPGVAVLVNGRPVAQGPGALTLLLHDGDEVAIFPPLAGGSSLPSSRTAMPHRAGGWTLRGA
jgi:molybdopterin converting factor small subunit